MTTSCWNRQNLIILSHAYKTTGPKTHFQACREQQREKKRKWKLNPNIFNLNQSIYNTIGLRHSPLTLGQLYQQQRCLLVLNTITFNYSLTSASLFKRLNSSVLVLCLLDQWCLYVIRNNWIYKEIRKQIDVYVTYDRVINAPKLGQSQRLTYKLRYWVNIGHEQFNKDILNGNLGGQWHIRTWWGVCLKQLTHPHPHPHRNTHPHMWV